MLLLWLPHGDCLRKPGRRLSFNVRISNRVWYRYHTQAGTITHHEVRKCTLVQQVDAQDCLTSSRHRQADGVD
jgi:hypothetical protein